MTGRSGPEFDPATVDGLLDAGDLQGARAILATAPQDDPRGSVLRIKLGLLDGSLAPAQASLQLVRLMQGGGGDIPGAKELYQEASRRAYSEGQSSSAHSHPPPRAKERGG